MALKDKVIKGVKWNAVATVYSMVVQILRLVILTRFLDKSDFGLVAIATMIISFTEIFSDLGITVALIHKQDISEHQYSSVFWLNIFISIFLYVIVCLFTPFIASVYSENILLVIVPLLSVQILLNSFGKMFQTIKTKELEFGFLSKIKIFSSTMGLILMIVLAWKGYGIFSLVWGQLLQVAINQFIYIYGGRKGTKIRFHFNLAEISEILKIGSFQLGARIMDVVASKIDILLIGKFFGMDDLGVYNLAKELILRPIQIIQQLTGSVASSAFAKIQKNLPAARKHFSQLLQGVTSLSFPIYLAIFVFAEPIVEIMYSSKFIETAFFLRVLSIYGMFTSIESVASSLLVSYGKTNLAFYMTLLNAILSVPVIILASNYTIKAVAYGQLVLVFINYFIRWYYAVKTTIDMGLGLYARSVSMPLIVSLTITVPFALFFLICDFTITTKIFLAVVYAFCYPFLYYLIAPDYFKSVLAMAFKKQI